MKLQKTKPEKPYEIRISYHAVEDYLKEYGSVEITKESFEAFKSWLYDDIHKWLKDNVKAFPRIIRNEYSLNLSNLNNLMIKLLTFYFCISLKSY